MDTALFVALSHQSAMRRQMDVVANNIANMNTTAFKKESVMFQEFVQELDNGELGTSQISYVLDFGVARDFTEGAHTYTSNPMDVAITGPGFIEVTGDDGDIKYTRNGHLMLDPDGFIITSTGQRVHDTAGGEIQLQPGDNIMTIMENGLIITENAEEPLGPLSLYEFDNAQALKKLGDNLYETTAEPKTYGQDEVKQSKFLQFMLEGSNVNAIEEVTRMIHISRSYQSVAKMLSESKDMRKDAINQLGRTG